MDPDKEELLLLMLKQAGKRDAIALYQDETGVGRQDAANAVEEIARRRGAASGGIFRAASICTLVGLLTAMLVTRVLGY